MQTEEQAWLAVMQQEYARVRRADLADHLATRPDVPKIMSIRFGRDYTGWASCRILCFGSAICTPLNDAPGRPTKAVPSLTDHLELSSKMHGGRFAVHTADAIRTARALDIGNET